MGKPKWIINVKSGKNEEKTLDNSHKGVLGRVCVSSNPCSLRFPPQLRLFVIQLVFRLTEKKLFPYLPTGQTVFNPIAVAQFHWFFVAVARDLRDALYKSAGWPLTAFSFFFSSVPRRKQSSCFGFISKKDFFAVVERCLSNLWMYNALC